jgi:hypothetical protein
MCANGCELSGHKGLATDGTLVVEKDAVARTLPYASLNPTRSNTRRFGNRIRAARKEEGILTMGSLPDIAKKSELNAWQKPFHTNPLAYRNHVHA